MKQLFTLLFCFSIFSSNAQLNLSYVADLTYDEDLSDIWGFRHPDGTEYALVGARNGVSVVSLANPASPVEVAYADGASSTWRDIKTFGNYAYVTNETGGGVAVLNLNHLPDSVPFYNWSPNIPGMGSIISCHNIYIDEKGFAYLSGCNINGGGLLVVDVFSDPGNPQFVSAAPPQNSHDVYVRGDTIYNSEISNGVLAIYDGSNKQNITLMATQPTPALTTHNAWLSDDGKTVFTTDETSNAPVTAYDISNLNNIVELDQYRPYATLGDGVIPHNVHVWNDFLIVSYYTDGCILLDANRPENLVEVGNFDTFIPPSTGFQGVWGAYPFLPSGLILATDIGNGLYILEPNYVRACYLEGTVTDASNGQKLGGVTMKVLSTPAIEFTDLQGQYKTGQATAGTYEIQAFKAGYEQATKEAILNNGVVTVVDFELQPLPSFTFVGKVVDASNDQPIADAKISIDNDFFSFERVTDANGEFSITTFYEGVYEIFAGKWGYQTQLLSTFNIDENTAAPTFRLEPGYEDVFSLDLGWEVQTNIPFGNGGFERGDPIGVMVPQAGNLLIQPEDDVPQDIGNHCYVTGNIADLFNGVIIGGSSSITSPSFDISNYNDARIGYYHWYLNINTGGTTVGDDPMFVVLSDGQQEVFIDTITYPMLDTLRWKYSEIKVSDFFPPSANMKVRFLVNSPDFNDAIEAAVDYFRVWDAMPVNTIEPSDVAQLQVYPNPSPQAFTLDYALQKPDAPAELVVYNVLGRNVASYALGQAIGQLRFGAELAPGVYLIKIQQGEQSSQTLRVVKR